MTQNAGAQFGYEDHFTPVRTRKKRKNRPQAAPPSPAVLLNRASEELANSDWLDDAQQTLRESLEEAFTALDAAQAVLCLGLGSPASSRDARAQLAFLLAACDDLSIDRTRVSVFDPVFVDQDLELLAQLRLTHLSENQQASYGMRSPTIVFMPHCDLHLYENLLRENWSQERLPNVFLIANRLSDYAESIPSRKLTSEHPCVARLAPYLTSRPLRPCTPYPTAFNNTSIQFVRSACLEERDADWWELPGRPPSVSPTSASERPASAPDGALSTSAGPAAEQKARPAPGAARELDDGETRAASANAVAAAAASVPVRPQARSRARGHLSVGDPSSPCTEA
ncbi:hypothetical protein BD414DRAFT_476187 [Trametes punicea]|nr:hypothetical protein BD414DRAFT_476187 [Trametes punicea]